MTTSNIHESKRNPYERSKNVRLVPASQFMATIAVNVDNAKLSDADFREFIRNTLPVVEYPRPGEK